MIFNFLRFNILIVFVFEISSIYSFSNNVTDEQALLSFKHSITNDPSGVLHSWNKSIHFCHWTGVTCSRRQQRVTALNLSSLELVGTLSPHIGNLSFLRAIFLNWNHLQGFIPNEIGRLFRLQYLSLDDNSFQGVFPANLSHCEDIRTINISGNDLKGKLPTEFASWSRLIRFNLGYNDFTGLIPPSIGNISSARNLFLGHNNLAGGIPSQVGCLAKLELLALEGNNLSSMVPLSLYNISSLHGIDLSQNELEGTLPADLGFTLPKLQEFYAGFNRFSGPFPPSIANASSLVRFDITTNNITGPLPNSLGNLANLQLLSLGQNPLGDNRRQHDDQSFFNSLANCTHLNTLRLFENGLQGKLLISMVNLSTTIQVIYLYENHIHGSIPHEIGKLVNMRLLSLGQNFITGTIPESVGELSKLGELDLADNNISGVIPTSVSNITQLLFLSLRSNMLQGTMPSKLFHISTLQKLDLSNNRLTGVIPVEILFSSQCIMLFLAQNLFTGPLPSNIGNMKQLVILYVSQNRLTGDIPTTLGGCVMLEELYMDNNLFQGKIPSSFKALKSLAFLDLSNNNISGSIPSFFDKFRLMIFLNLSHNKLGGEVSKEGIFSNSSAFSVVGNLELCGGIPALHFPSCPPKISRNLKNKISMRIILVLVLVPLGILLACLSLFCYRHRNSKKLNEPGLVLKDNQYPKVSYQDLLLATNEFSPNNLLGQGRYGSVYKGVLDSVEDIVAVKVLNNEVRGANKTFLAECETLRNIRHRNLIKIITACSSIDFRGSDFKALVFEFMTNGSLDNWLHPSTSYPGNGRNLTLLQRLNISIDVALGVDYLHHHGHASIIHSDIKPSNILLDEDFVAHIGDFGLARFSLATTIDVNQAQMSSTGVRGTIGYVPPEYGMWGEISTEGDVYSYGILLLEMFSGKRPTEMSILVDGGGNLHDYVRSALPEGVMDIADPRILVEQDQYGLNVNQSYSSATMEVCLALIFEVGILCSEETPSNRIDISVAIKQLRLAKDRLLQHAQ